MAWPVLRSMCLLGGLGIDRPVKFSVSSNDGFWGREVNFFSGSAPLAGDPSFIPWLTESALGSGPVFLFVA